MNDSIKIFIKLTVILVFLCRLGATGIEIKQDQKNLADNPINVQQLLQLYLTDKYSSGVGIVVGCLENGAISYFSAGKKYSNSDELVSEDTIFEIGSITKVFTTRVLMEMVQEGLIALDDPVENFLPFLRVPQKNGKKITLRHLATHTSGLPRLPSNLKIRNNQNPYADYTIERLYECINAYELIHEPGAHFKYSNLGMGLLGHVLSLITGKSYEKLIQERICNILSMPNTTITIPSEKNACFAHGHCMLKKVENWDIPVLAGAAALRSTAKDMMQFLKVQMDCCSSDLLQKTEAIDKSVPVSALGWMLSQKNDSTIIWHNGLTGGFSSFVGFNKQCKKGVIILANSSDSFCDKLGFYLLGASNSINCF